jgi:hypothetical protein
MNMCCDDRLAYQPVRQHIGREERRKMEMSEETMILNIDQDKID